MDKSAGSVIYTQLGNEDGGIEADLTVTRPAADRFYIVTGSGFGVHDAHWIDSHLPKDGSAFLIEVTSGNAVINLCGPKARTVLEAVADKDVSTAAFPFANPPRIALGATPALALRVGQLGVLGTDELRVGQVGGRP